MPEAQREIERKYEAPEGAVPDLERLTTLSAQGMPEVQELEATYFDTADRALGRSQMVARRRRGGHDEGWHIKFSLGSHRHEVHFPLLKDGTSMPAAFCSALTAVTLGQDLEPVLQLSTRRSRTLLQDEHGQHVAELCDDTVESRDCATGVERRWREWEVELAPVDLGKKQRRRIFEDVEAVLLAAGGRPSSAVAKSARALGQDPDFDAAHGIQQPSGGGQQRPRRKGSEGADRSGAEELVSALLAEDLALLGPWTLAALSSVEGAPEALGVPVRSVLRLLGALEDVLACPGAAVPEAVQVFSGVEQALASVRELETVRGVLESDAAWSALTQGARREILELLAEDQEAAGKSLRTALEASDWAVAVAAVHSLAHGGELRGWASGLSAKKLARRLLKSLRKQASADAGALVEEGSLEEVAESLASVQAAARQVREGIEDLRAEVRLPAQQQERWKERRKRAKKVQNRLVPILELNTAREWTARAARVFQRRGVDRYAVGLLSGRLEMALEGQLAAGLPPLD